MGKDASTGGWQELTKKLSWNLKSASLAGQGACQACHLLVQQTQSCEMLLRKSIIGEDKKKLLETIDQRKGSEVIANEDFVELTCPVFDHHLVHPSP